MNVPCRVATNAEAERYRGQLYPLQESLFAIAADYEELALAGGTALARCYFDHRYSEGVDLSTQADRVDTLAAAVLNRALRQGFDVEVERRGSTHVRAVVASGETRLVVDFANDLPLVEPTRASPLPVNVYGLRDLAANKLGAFENRAEAKDLVDLYEVTKVLSWEQIFDDAESKRVLPPTIRSPISSLSRSPTKRSSCGPSIRANSNASLRRSSER